MFDKPVPQNPTTMKPDLNRKLADDVRRSGTEQEHSETSGPPASQRTLLIGGDLFCLFLASIPFFLCELRVVHPFRRGVTCGDVSLSYPYLPHEVVPDELLISAGLLITGLTISVGECYRVRYQGDSSQAFVRNQYVSFLYKELGSFLFGCSVGQSLTNMAKLSVGRLRPHFLSVCGVTYASLNCTPGSYVATVICRQPDNRLVEEARKSFFSGHASFSMFTMLYLACVRPHHAYMDSFRQLISPGQNQEFYLQARWAWPAARLLRPLLQSSLVVVAVYTGLTRVSDHRHHPSDVLTGLLLGATTAYWVAFHISPMFKGVGSPSPLPLDKPHTPHTIC